MDRRDFLRVGALLGTIGTAGCLGVFETQSAWRDPPLVEDRPEAAYIPASTEEMGTYGVTEVGEYTVSLLYTFPHRFWTVTGTETNMVDVGDEDALHLMASVWETDSGIVVPADVRLTVEGESAPYTGQLWAMLAQRMGFHYGDNLAIEEGEYTARLDINPAGARGVGRLEGLFEEPRTAEIDFEYTSDDVYDLTFDLVEESRRGNRGELPLMDHEGMAHGGDGDHTHGGMARPTVPPADSFPAEVLGTGESGDATFVVASEPARFDEPTLVVSPRTPHNRTMLPLMALSATVQRGTETVFEGALESRLDTELGFHYGAPVGIDGGETIRIDIESVPQVARHDGYETAFFEMPPVEIEN
ncbi:DUF7350 domain-containing protein [Halalkalicoccus jeotgali]|uniref:DUF7350 domain-containing protein n=1 Tax=Halalkalicoccus jeotgali (strain DSM 18796 / CECT 7217 / JCM 14584 / KCTC 4019 / B3) TaxID=795797 RepID=D8J6V8_HALJB|nr:hypothetical protein [Halalkalicoccus jeotgali]ADJ15911.1 hypothetical protein HacjB3_12650 [Halalkalicoccus jeotgali B3]ELY38007.1 hypothetical protein C497_07854 [Halalkalicoccus jeotgali B3]